MSIWLVTKLKELTATVAELESRIQVLESKTSDKNERKPFTVIPEPADKRTKEWREWKNSTS